MGAGFDFVTLASQLSSQANPPVDYVPLKIGADSRDVADDGVLGEDEDKMEGDDDEDDGASSWDYTCRVHLLYVLR